MASSPSSTVVTNSLTASLAASPAASSPASSVVRTRGPSPAASSPAASSAGGDYPYTPEEYAAMFLDFYTLLTTMHFRPSELQVPPPQGWFQMPPGGNPGWKSDFALEVMRRLPHLSGSPYDEVFVHYKSSCLGCVGPEPWVLQDGTQWDYHDGWCAETHELDVRHLIPLTTGHESGGRDIFLDVRGGYIIEEEIRGNTAEYKDARDYLQDLKEKYRTLKLIPCRNRDTIEAQSIGEYQGERRLTMEEVLAQDDDTFHTELDIHFLRQVYRDLGWPNNFDPHKAEDEIGDLMETETLEERYLW